MDPFTRIYVALVPNRSQCALLIFSGVGLKTFVPHRGPERMGP